jgi:hypothetical protein
MSSDPIVLDEEIVRDDGTPRQNVQARAAVNSRENPDHVAAELAAARHIHGLLRRVYPGHSWMVDVSVQKGGVAISIPVLLGGNWVYFIKGSDLSDWKVVEAGGEILERFRLPRGAFELGSWQEARRRFSLMLHPQQKVPS